MNLIRRAMLAGVGLLAAAVVPAASATTVDFATLSGANASSFTSYTENGFTVTNSQGQFFVGQVYGDPVPDIFAGPFYGPATDAITITAVGGGSFSLDQFSFSSNNGSTAYTLTGSLSGAPVFSVSGTESVLDTFVTITPGTSADVVNSVTLQFTGQGSSFNVDNIGLTPVAPTPEPSSLALLGTGLAGFAAAVRRRFR